MIREIPLLRTVLLGVLLLHLSGCATSAQQHSESEELYRQTVNILESVPLIDGHNDIPWQYHTRVGHRLTAIDLMDTSAENPPIHTDLQRLSEGHVGGQFWSAYVPASIPESEAVQQTLEQIDFIHRMVQAWPDHLQLALTADGIEQAFERGRIASLIGLEGGHSIGNSLAVLRQFYRLGARYMTLTHSRTLDWADSATDTPHHDGLSSFGEEVVREMNRLGMVVDLSHVSEATMQDAIYVSEAPVLFSHSSAKGISGHARNVPDAILDRIQENGGVVMVTFVPSYISEELRQYYAREHAEEARLEALYPDRPKLAEKEMEQWYSRNPMPEVTLGQVADHIDYIRDRIGVRHIGIGGDYDGITMLPEGLEDVSTYPRLFAELLSRGYNPEELRQIAGLNLLRLFRNVEETAARLQRERTPSEVNRVELDGSE